MDDDPFDRMLRREEEIRTRLEEGEIDEAEAEALRDLADGDDRDGAARANAKEWESNETQAHGRSTTDGRLRLTVEQVAMISDEGVDPAVIKALLELSPDLTATQAIDLAVDYGLDMDSVRALATAGVPALEPADLVAIIENEVCRDTLRAAAAYGSPRPIETAVLLTERASDPTYLLRELTRAGIAGLTDEQLGELADNDIEPRTLCDMLEADPSLNLDLDQAIALCVQEIDPETIRRLHAEGIAVDADRLTRSSASRYRS